MASSPRGVLGCSVAFGFTVKRSYRIDVRRDAAVVPNQDLLRLLEPMMPEIVRREAVGKSLSIHVERYPRILR